MIRLLAALLLLTAAAAPSEKESHLLRARARYDRGDLVGALADAERVLRADPSDPRAQALVGLLRKAAADAVAAESAQGAADGLPADEALPEGLDGMAAPGSLKDEPATPAAEKAAVLLREAGARAKVGDYAAARDLAAKVLELFPKSPGAYIRRSGSRLALGDFAGAEEDATRALDLGLRHPAVFLLRAEARLKSGKPAEAAADAGAAIALEPRGARAYAVRALAAQISGRPPAEVLADLERAAALDRRYGRLLAGARKSLGADGGPSRAMGMSAPRIKLAAAWIVFVWAVFFIVARRRR